MTTTIAYSSGLAAAQDLRAVMQGQVVAAGEDAYADVRRIWNGAVHHRPAVFARCETVEDVQNAVRTARVHNLPLSVRGPQPGARLRGDSVFGPGRTLRTSRTTSRPGRE
jgi:FAD/FMN-containing dehydrogenase